MCDIGVQAFLHMCLYVPKAMQVVPKHDALDVCGLQMSEGRIITCLQQECLPACLLHGRDVMVKDRIEECS